MNGEILTPGVKRASEELLSQNSIMSNGAVMSPQENHIDNSNDAKKVKLENKCQSNGKPSRVVHIRNIPNDVTEAEIVQLGIPFGRVTNVLVLKGKNQAFLEMSDEVSASTMVNYFTNCAAQLRNRTVYVQFSNHKELKTDLTHSNSNASAQAALQAAQAFAGQCQTDTQGGPNTVLRVIIEHMVYPVTLDVLYQIFSSVGKVWKIVTFTKNNTFQALIQYLDVVTAQAAKLSLDGQNIYNACCTLRIEYSKLSSLNVKYNNEKSRDYTNPNLPTGDSALDSIASLTEMGSYSCTSLVENCCLSPCNSSHPFCWNYCGSCPCIAELPSLCACKEIFDPLISSGNNSQSDLCVWSTQLTYPPPGPSPNPGPGFFSAPQFSDDWNISSGTKGSFRQGGGTSCYENCGYASNCSLGGYHSCCTSVGAPGVLASLNPMNLNPPLAAPYNNPGGMTVGGVPLGGNMMAALAAVGVRSPSQSQYGCVLLVSNLDEEAVTPDALFTLFGVYGDVQRVKVLFNKKDSALVQMAEPLHAQIAISHLDKLKVWGKHIRVIFSKHQTVQMPKEGQPDAGLTKDFMNSSLHRFKKPGSKNYQNIYPPSATLHLSNIPSSTLENDIVEAFEKEGFDIKAFKFFPKDHKMALIQLNSIEEAVLALMKMHNHQMSESNHLRVSFSKSTI